LHNTSISTSTNSSTPSNSTTTSAPNNWSTSIQLWILRSKSVGLSGHEGDPILKT
jgi:hypothetical protein